ncbi:MAG TPA: hypothetical protein VF487_05740 [Chitinophagaceae bacterium]
MKPGTFASRRLWLPVLAIGIIVALASWDFKQTPVGYQQQDHSPTDTTPKKKKTVTEKKVRDLDDVIDELDAIDIQKEMEKAQLGMAKALKEIDDEKIRMTVEKAIREVDFSKIKLDIEKAMKDIDMQKIQTEVQESLAKVDWNKMKLELEEAKKIDFTKMEQEMKNMKEELSKIRPQLEKELANVKVDMEKAKGEIEKAKAEMKEYKEFVDGLDKDGLINKKGNYTIKHADAELTVNGKKVSTEVYSKYRSFLEKHKKFSIEKTDDDFDIDMD